MGETTREYRTTIHFGDGDLPEARQALSVYFDRWNEEPDGSVTAYSDSKESTMLFAEMAKRVGIPMDYQIEFVVNGDGQEKAGRMAVVYMIASALCGGVIGYFLGVLL